MLPRIGANDLSSHGEAPLRIAKSIGIDPLFCSVCNKVVNKLLLYSGQRANFALKESPER